MSRERETYIYTGGGGLSQGSLRAISSCVRKVDDCRLLSFSLCHSLCHSQGEVLDATGQPGDPLRSRRRGGLPAHVPYLKALPPGADTGNPIHLSAKGCWAFELPDRGSCAEVVERERSVKGRGLLKGGGRRGGGEGVWERSVKGRDLPKGGGRRGGGEGVWEISVKGRDLPKGGGR